jgi:uncharacterized protein YyaL (SSP411 family)
MPNQLADQTSPYLLQHANNPVNWFPWGKEALEIAAREDKPIFLSIGYAACHWCHVMAHESFEDPETARLMNENFVNIKVDREERPDLDSIYMNAVVAITGQGGWPMSVFLTPSGQPFYGGTYFPPVPRYRMPAFREVLLSIARIWKEDRPQVFKASGPLMDHLYQSLVQEIHPVFTPALPDLVQATQKLAASYDWQHGGWGHAPRFPGPLTIEFLLQQGARDEAEPVKMASHALHAMQRGGIYDVVGGGFHRYSTDDHWLVPHFEKMLYDNAQLALAYLHAYQLTGDISFRQTCEETLDFLLREMVHPAGGFFSSLDADSEGREGKFYVWDLSELQSALHDPEDQRLFFRAYAVSPEGNFEGKIILQRSLDNEELAHLLNLPIATVQERLTACHRQLRVVRDRRIRPNLDDKVLTAWNALTIRALAEAARSLNRSDYLAAAQKSAEFLLEHLYLDGHLYRSWRGGQARHNAYLEDYASLSLALLALYQADPNPRWFDWSRRLTAEMLTGFSDPDGGFFDTHIDQDPLIVRPKDLQDNATPSGNALAALALLVLSEYTGQGKLREQAEAMIGAVKMLSLKHPTAFSFWLQALDFAVGPIQQIAVVWPANNPPPAEFFSVIHAQYCPRTILASTPYPPGGSGPELLNNRSPQNGLATAFVCQGFVCLLPVTSPGDLAKQLV